jgi:hypothetical protein
MSDSALVKSQSLGVGHPIWGTHKKMTEKAEQELHEFVRLKHHSHGLKNQHFGEFSLFRDQETMGSNPSPRTMFSMTCIIDS